MDLLLPGIDEVAAITTICAEFPTARVIVLTIYDGDEDIYQALHAGAKGYLLKGAESETFLKIMALRRGIASS